MYSFVVKEDSKVTRGESQPHNKISNKQVISSILSKCILFFSFYSDLIHHFTDFSLNGILVNSFTR